MISNIIQNARALWHAESIIADLHFRHLLTRTILKAFAGLIAVFGLVMLNVTAFFALEQPLGRIWAAASLSVIDFVVAAALVVIASLRPVSRELALALEVRQTAIQGFELEARALQDQFSALTNEVRSIKTAMSNFAKHPLDEALSQLIIPLAGVITRNLSKKRASKKAGASSAGSK